MIPGLNSNHRRSLLAGFHHIDDLLGDVESSANTSDSPFAKRFNDLSPVERKVVLDSVAAIRERMASAVRAIEVALPAPRTAASWAIQTTLSFAQITVQEMDPKRLAGYGTVGPEAVELLQSLNSDLERNLKRLIAYLARGTGKDLAGRLDRLEATSVDVSTVKALGEIITEHGLVEFQGTLQALVERLENPSFEIAVFGRVSSGKSSLLNSITGFPALPVGVTPVTAVPTRVCWGEEPEAEIRFAEAVAETVPLSRLAEFVSEDLNPDNRKHVRRAVVRIPADFLRGGVVFVDTPGIGSLATSGARESYAYLPRCDVGILLVDAGSTPGREEIDLLRLLYESGIPPMLVMSKADLLSDGDRGSDEEIRRERNHGAPGDVSPHSIRQHGRRRCHARPVVVRARDPGAHFPVGRARRGFRETETRFVDRSGRRRAPFGGSTEPAMAARRPLGAPSIGSRRWRCGRNPSSWKHRPPFGESPNAAGSSPIRRFNPQRRKSHASNRRATRPWNGR